MNSFPLNSKPELLSPAGNLEKLKYAFAYGADAVYVGAPKFSLRARGDELTYQDFAEGLSWAHERGKQVYLAANLLAHDEDLSPFQEFMAELAPLGFDGIIVADLGLLDWVRTNYPDLAVHVSTQANTTNSWTARFYERLGVKRLVLARELSLEAIRGLRDAVGLELEAFVHGAMCISYSGRCLLSNYFSTEHPKAEGVRDANRGDCSQVCRWEFALAEQSRPEVSLPIEEDAYGTAILSSRDLNMARHVQELLKAGVNSLKIEGRMKSAWYTASATRVYRHSLDRAMAAQAPDEAVLAELQLLSRREYTTGFYFQTDRKTDADGQLRGQPHRNSLQDRRLLGLVEQREANQAVCRALNTLRKGQRVVAMNPGRADQWLTADELWVDGEQRDMVRIGERFTLHRSGQAESVLDEFGILLAPSPKEIL
ncbi:MAG: U32 family peptidase [Spirochaetales bacterium]|nr:U32 family peptidase [Spirochaetales bacterium]